MSDVARGAWSPVPVDHLEADPAQVRGLARELAKLGERLLDAGAAFGAGAAVPHGSFSGAAGARFRGACGRNADAAAEGAADVAALAVAAAELARDLDEVVRALAEMRDTAAAAGLEVGGAAIWPPHPTVRREDSPDLRRRWRAFDRCWELREAMEDRRDVAFDDWREALFAFAGVTAHVESCDPGPGPYVPDLSRPAGRASGERHPEAPSPRDPRQSREARAGSAAGPSGSPAPSPAHSPATSAGEERTGVVAAHAAEPSAGFDTSSRAVWIEGHRGRDGGWVHAHWQPLGPSGHADVAVAATWVTGHRDADGVWVPGHWDGTGGHPHAGEHPSGASTARWVDGRWEPQAPQRPPAFPAIARTGPGG